MLEVVVFSGHKVCYSGYSAGWGGGQGDNTDWRLLVTSLLRPDTP